MWFAPYSLAVLSLVCGLLGGWPSCIFSALWSVLMALQIVCEAIERSKA
jgi:hypothetical protein